MLVTQGKAYKGVREHLWLWRLSESCSLKVSTEGFKAAFLWGEGAQLRK